MALLRERKFAALIMVVMIVLSIFGGSYRSLSALRNEAETVFYNGANGDGLGIYNDLEKRVALSYNLMTIALKYVDDEEPTLVAVEEAREKLISAGEPEEKYRANLSLTEATTALLSTLEGLALSEKDETYRIRIQTELKSADDTISHDPYNQYAQEFNSALGTFPANLLGKLMQIHSLSLFR